MKVTLKDVPALDFSGTPIPDHMGKLACQMLGTSKSGDPIKLYEMGIKIRDNVEVELDTADVELLESSIKASEIFVPFVRGQVLLEIKRSKK